MKISLSNRLYLLLVQVFIVICAFNSYADTRQPATITAKLDSVQILMGRMTMLNVEVVTDKNKKGHLPILELTNQHGVISALNDSVELRGAAEIDTVELGSNRIQINYKIPVQSFDSGLYRLPPIEYVVDKDTFRSNQVVLKVNPLILPEDAEIDGYMPPEEPFNSSILDYLPNWLVDYWWLLLLIVLITIIVIYLIKNKKKVGTLLPIRQQKILSPYEEAINSLHKLKDEKLWEQGLEKEYFTQLTEILRHYLYRRFNINALEMTSQQIIMKLSENPEIKSKREYMRKILDTADYVKFAKMRPLPSDSIESWESALRFVEETKPIDTEESNDENNSKQGKEVGL